MAPELKRVRSKPAEWWAAQPTSSIPPPAAQAAAVPSKKREREQSLVKKMENAGNRGQAAKRKSTGNDEDEENMDPQPSKPVRRGRSSVGERELRGIGETSSANVQRKPFTSSKQLRTGNDEDDVPQPTKNSNTLRKPALPQSTAESATHNAAARRGRSSNTEAELKGINYKETANRKRSSLNVDDEAQTKAMEPKVPKPNKVSEKAAVPRAIIARTTSTGQPGSSKAIGKSPSKNPAPSRRGRSSNTEAELQALNYKETATKKQARTNFGKETPAKTIEKSNTSTQGEHRRGRSSNTEAELRAPVNYKESKTLNRRVVADALAETPSSVTTASQDNDKHATRRRALVASSKPGPSRGGGPAGAVTSQDVDVEVASSKFSKSRSKSAARPTVETKHTTTKAHSRNTNSVKTQKSRKETEVAVSKVTRPELTKSKRPSEGSQKKRKSVAQEAIAEVPAPKRQRNDKAQERDQLEKAPEYQHLAAVNRKVSHATIESKWEALPPSSAERISGLLQDIQRPVIARLNDEKKRGQASTALQSISRKLVTKISRGLPFPPSIRNNREDDFDFEKIMDHTRSMEAQLTPALHSNELLQAELAKEKALLVAEQAYLDELEGNAKAESTKRKQSARNIHTLLQPSGTTNTKELDDDFSVNTTDPTRPVTLNLLQDENLQAVVADLQGHVDSIEGNLKQVEGIAQAIAKSKAAVQATLFGRLDRVLYEDLVLG